MIDIAPDAVDGRFVPEARPGVATVLVGREIVLGRIAAGTSRVQTCALNESGSIVWQCFDGSGTIDEIAADIADVFGVDVAAVSADVAALAREVGGAGFLVGVEERVIELGTDDRGIAVGLPFPLSVAPRRGRRSLVVSWSETCAFCELIAADLADLEPSLADAGVDIALEGIGDARGPFEGLGTPVAYLVDEHGNVAEPVALGATEVIGLARRIAMRAGTR